MTAKILMIDDHSAMITGYKTILSHNNLGHIIEATVANNCETAYNIITNTTNPVFFDLVLLDYSLPPYPEQKIFFGEDLAVLLKKHLPNTKILMITAHFDAFRLYNIIKKAQPNGLMVKSDFDDTELILAYEQVWNGKTYYSQTVTQALKERLLTEGQLDSIDRQIITLIAEGRQIKSIAQIINISEDTVKKRKSKIKDLLGLEKGNDEDILRECRLLRLI